ncbi:hypothetical protein [Hyphococcus sp.]|jgi:hypothetical protein|uniref:hypothetical protein n=1 Tax=Hyphococcus sp. TaxID=2038636 RepID=UPI003D0A2868
MEKKDWDQWEKLYKKYEEKRQVYEAALAHVGGTFSELARHYDRDKFDQNGFVREEEAHEEFRKAREELHQFLHEKVKKD